MIVQSEMRIQNGNIEFYILKSMTNYKYKFLYFHKY